MILIVYLRAGRLEGVHLHAAPIWSQICEDDSQAVPDRSSNYAGVYCSALSTAPGLKDLILLVNDVCHMSPGMANCIPLNRQVHLEEKGVQNSGVPPWPSSFLLSSFSPCLFRSSSSFVGHCSFTRFSLCSFSFLRVSLCLCGVVLFTLTLTTLLTTTTTTTTILIA